MKPVAIFALVLAVACSAATAPPKDGDRIVPQSMEQVRLSFAPIVERAAPAVVNVYSKRVVKTRPNPFADDPFFSRFFGGDSFGAPQERVQNSLGSGVIVSPDGVIVTNNHVINGMTEIKVVLSDRREFPAEVVQADPKTDLAVLRIKAKEPLPFIEFADSDAAEVGDVVLAIGNPFGVGQTVTSGIVSALARTNVGVSDFQFFIQTDAAINPGNSGGALVDGDGRLVGVNSAIYSRSGGSNGIGFAIPSNLVRQVVNSIVHGDSLERPWIGAAADSVTSNLSAALKLDRPGGAVVTDLYKGGPAAKAGLKPGDVILAVDGKSVLDSQTLRYRVGTRKNGETVPVEISRDGRTQTVNVKVDLPPNTPKKDERVVDGENPLNGVTIANLSPAYAEELGLSPFEKGVIVTAIDPRSYAARRGLRKGYRILSVNGDDTPTVAELVRAVEHASNGWSFEIEVAGGRVVDWRVRG